MTLLMEEKPKVGTKYIDALRARFGSAIMDEAWQAPDQVTVTVPLNSVPAISCDSLSVTAFTRIWKA